MIVSKFAARRDTAQLFLAPGATVDNRDETKKRETPVSSWIIDKKHNKTN